jgi:hypothetical protein
MFVDLPTPIAGYIAAENRGDEETLDGLSPKNGYGAPQRFESPA